MGLPATLPGPLGPSAAPATPILTKTPAVTFATRQVSPPSEVYVTTDDSLHVVVYSSMANVALTVAFRVLKPDGEVMRQRETITPTADRVRNDRFFVLPEGFLLSVDVSTLTANVVRGQVWVDVDVSQGVPPTVVDYQSILSDYITVGASIGYPGARQISPVEGPGAILNQTGAGQPASNNIQFVAPVGARWRFLSMFAQLITGAAVANRQVSVFTQPNSSGFYQFDCPNTQAASLTVNYRVTCVPLTTPAAALNQLLPVPDNLLMESSGRLLLICNNAQAGDTWNQFGIAYEEWLEPTA
jgi:hypothetical protein